MSKSNLPLTMTGERIEYQRLYDLTGTAGRNMTTSGVYSFTSLSSGLIYSTSTGGEYNVFLQLQTALNNYNYNDVDANDISNKLANLYSVYETTGTANTYAVTISPIPSSYTDGMPVVIKINVASTGASTLNINGLGAKPILDSLGNAIVSGGLKVGIIYSLRYNATTGNFIVQGKGGGGNATAPQLLSGATATVDTGPITGTMPNLGDLNLVPTSNQYNVGSGYVHSVIVPAVIFDTSKVLAGTTIAGTPGTMPENGALNFTPSASQQTGPAGHTTGVTVAAVTFNAAKVLNDTTIAGTPGTMPENGAIGGTITTQGGTLTVLSGHTTGGTITASLANFDASKIIDSASIGGTPGVYPTNPSSGTASWTTPGTYNWTVPAGVTRVLASLYGGGGSGGSSSGSIGSGGGGGSFRCAWVNVTSGSSVAVVVGAGGTAIPLNTTANGNTGGTTSFGSVSTPGGGGGSSQTTTIGVGGVGSSASPSIANYNGGDTVYALSAGTGGGGGAGSGGNGNIPTGTNSQTGGTGGIVSPYTIIPGVAGGAGGSISGVSGLAGAAPGGGGGGGGYNGVSGAGAQGAVYIQW